MAELSAMSISRKKGLETLRRDGTPVGPTLLSFWQWAASDLVSNSMRGVFAEWLVAVALRLAAGVRGPWDAVDLVTPEGKKIEVKSAAYLQSWFQSDLSRICFTIRPTRYWDATTNTLGEEIRRQADVYVFALLAHRDKATLDPLDVSQWAFYLLSARALDDAGSRRKSIGLAKLLSLKPIEARFEDLQDRVSKM